jgi:pimeloyl-ACP methyl ester carboxylesterase
MANTSDISPFRIDISQADLDDLADRLSRTRWTDEAPAGSADYGLPSSEVRRLVEYWRAGYDWRAHEKRINEYPQFTTEIDGQRIHFLHVRSAESDAFPLILTHGWPGTFVEYLDVIDRLTDPAAHGGDPADACHLVIPSLPGFAFSGPTSAPGWGTRRTAAAWVELMRRLGYERYGAAGNDAGSMVSPEVGRLDGGRVAGVHVTQVFSFPSGDPSEFAGLSAHDQAMLEKLQWFLDNKFSFNQLHSQQPQTIAHALADSPAGLLAWNGQLFTGETNSDATPDDDFILTNIALYWLTNTAGSAIRFYYEDAKSQRGPAEPTTVPLALGGVADDFHGVRRFAERDHQNVVQWHVFDEPGGHYAAHTIPDVLAADIRGFFRQVR